MSFISTFIGALPGAVAQGIIWGIMALGVHITFRVMDIADLTVDGSIATGGAACVMLIRGGVSAPVAVICAFLVGLICGAVTGLLHTKCGIPAILAGILTQLSLYSINLRIMKASANTPISVDKYHLVVSQRYVRVMGANNPILTLVILTGVIIALMYVFYGTEIGCALRATGNNMRMASAQGINTSSLIVLGCMIGNGLVALSGALLSQYQGAADVNMGRGAIVIGLAAVIIGEVLLGKITKNFAMRMVSVVIGAIIYYIILQLVLTLGMNTNDLKLITAIIVAIFLSIPHFKKGSVQK